MKTDSGALELYTAGQPDRHDTADCKPTPLSLAWHASPLLNGGHARALFCSLLLHGILLLIALAGWTLLSMEQPPSSVISVFTLQEGGEPEAPGVARSTNAPTPKHAKEPIANGIHDNNEVRPEIVASPSSSPLAKPEAGPVITPDPPRHAAAQHGDGSGGTASNPNTTPAAGTDEGAATTGVVLARPLYKTNPPPPYPRLARKLGQEGVVQLEVLVSVAGRVDDLRIAESSGHESLDAAALGAVRSWRFSAGQRNGQPVAMRVRVPVRFSLRDGN